MERKKKCSINLILSAIAIAMTHDGCDAFHLIRHIMHRATHFILSRHMIHRLRDFYLSHDAILYTLVAKYPLFHGMQ